MNKLISVILLLLPAYLSAQEFTSTERSTDVIELYTSEGCYSCPPADEWLTSLKEDAGLFKDFIPLAFHVDYWNYIGWDDRFSHKKYTERQRVYVRAGHVSQVYTPGIVVNSKEWSVWFKGLRKWRRGKENVGVLRAHLGDGKLHVEFAQKGASLAAYAAYLGFGLETEVKSGENSGKTLKHDFVVLDLFSQEKARSDQGEWVINLPEAPDHGQKKTGLAVWVSPSNSPVIVQSAGGFLEGS